MKTLNKNSVAVLVASCDRYSDLWPIFFHFYFMNWEDAPYRIYLGSNSKSFSHPKVSSIKIGDDKDFSSGIKKMLEQITEELVIVILDDFLILNSLDLKLFGKCIDEFVASNAVYLKLIDTYPLGNRRPRKFVTSRIEQNVRYMLGMYAAVWNRKWLLSNLKDGKSAWEVDVDPKSFNLSISDICLTMNPASKSKKLVKWHNAVIKGKWNSGTISLLKREGFGDYIGGRHKITFGLSIYIQLFLSIMKLFKISNFKWKAPS